ncbi:MAG: FKBP-type peptidyl-prolyl cis-trans isomerase [Zetaproteobacteria bacterium]|nr:MAG: FKBP-type peptidyl-prolyl cis-trans isomerase [Zetaproteobacteria bacterium]
MKKMLGITVAAALLMAGCNQGEKQEAGSGQTSASVASDSLQDEKARLSYAIGMDIGQSLQNLGVELDEAALTEGISDRLNGRKLKLSDEEAVKVQQAFFTKRAEKQAAERKQLAEKNKAEGEKFLAENAKREGVHVTESGLQYEVLKQGDGDRPKATDRVKVHYRGTLIDGTEFDSSYKRGEPAVLPLNGVIKGWTEGVQLMNVGSKYRFYLPPALAYGERGAGQRIGPNATLIFEVELLGIEKGDQQGG